MKRAPIPEPPSIVSASAPIPELIARLRGVRVTAEARAAALAKRRQQRTGWIVGGIVLAVIGAFILNDPSVLSLTIVFGLVGGGVAILAQLSGRGTRTAAQVCADDRCELAVSLLEALRLDAVADSFTLRVELTAADSPAKRAGSGRAGEWDVVHFVDPWLDLCGRLLDGSRFDLSLTARNHVRSRTALSASGRTKYKVKNKALHVGSLFLRVKPERHPGLPISQETAAEAVCLSPGSELRRLTLGEDTLHIVAARGSTSMGVSHVPAEGHHLAASLFTSLYAVLRRARTGAETTT